MFYIVCDDGRSIGDIDRDYYIFKPSDSGTNIVMLTGPVFSLLCVHASDRPFIKLSDVCQCKSRIYSRVVDQGYVYAGLRPAYLKSVHSIVDRNAANVLTRSNSTFAER